jgi:hypothetical protein
MMFGMFVYLVDGMSRLFSNKPSSSARKINKPPMILFLYIVRPLFSSQSMISAANLLLALILGP